MFNKVFIAVRAGKDIASVIISATDEKVALTLLKAFLSKKREGLVPQIVKLNTLYIEPPTIKEDEIKTWTLDCICNTDEKTGVLYTIGNVC